MIVTEMMIKHISMPLTYNITLKGEEDMERDSINVVFEFVRDNIDWMVTISVILLFWGIVMIALNSEENSAGKTVGVISLVLSAISLVTSVAMSVPVSSAATNEIQHQEISSVPSTTPAINVVSPSPIIYETPRQQIPSANSTFPVISVDPPTQAIDKEFKDTVLLPAAGLSWEIIESPPIENLHCEISGDATELKIYIRWNQNDAIYNSLIATFQESPISSSDIENAIAIYPNLWASNSSTKTQLEREVILGFPISDYKYNTAYVLILNMNQNLNVLAYTIIKIDGITTPATYVSSNWVEIEDAFMEDGKYVIEASYGIAPKEGAIMIVHGTNDGGNSSTGINETEIEMTAGSGRIRFFIRNIEYKEYRVYIHPIEHGDSWSPLATSTLVKPTG